MKKKILFLHHNFPGQFKTLAIKLSEENHDVRYLVETNYIGKLGKIECETVKTPDTLKNSSLNGQIACGKRFAESLRNLKKSGWYPDIIISHAGWGCGIFTKDIFPNSFKIAYNEWWFSHEAPEYKYNPENPWFRYNQKTLDSGRIRNLSLSFEISEADAIVTPTKWQASQLPKIFFDKVNIIHEGVDLEYFQYNSKWRSKTKKRITYATRGLEPMRGFPQFVEAVIPILDENEKTEVVIAGQDKIIYGGVKPKEGSFWPWARKKLEKFVDRNQVQYFGHLKLVDYARLLKSSHSHVYLSRPFVVSWSLLEAMSSGCTIVANKLPLISEIVDENQTYWCDLHNISSISESIRNSLSLNDAQREENGLSQRSLALKKWDNKISVQKWYSLLGLPHTS